MKISLCLLPPQALLRTLLALAAFSTAIAALKLWNEDFRYGYYYDSICHISTSSGWITPAPTDSPEEVRRLHVCTSFLYMLKVGGQGEGAAAGGAGMARPGEGQESASPPKIAVTYSAPSLSIVTKDKASDKTEMAPVGYYRLVGNTSIKIIISEPI